MRSKIPKERKLNILRIEKADLRHKSRNFLYNNLYSEIIKFEEFVIIMPTLVEER